MRASILCGGLALHPTAPCHHARSPALPLVCHCCCRDLALLGQILDKKLLSGTFRKAAAWCFQAGAHRDTQPGPTERTQDGDGHPSRYGFAAPVSHSQTFPSHPKPSFLAFFLPGPLSAIKSRRSQCLLSPPPRAALAFHLVPMQRGCWEPAARQHRFYQRLPL